MKSVTLTNTTTSSQLTTVLSYGAILLLGYLVFLIAEPFLVPLAWSAVLAIFFYPLHERLQRKMRPTPAALTSTLGVTLLLIVPALVVLVFTAREALDATAREGSPAFASQSKTLRERSTPTTSWRNQALRRTTTPWET